jgi:hypothetical protein
MFIYAHACISKVHARRTKMQHTNCNMRYAKNVYESLGMENAQGLLRLQQNGMQQDATVSSCCDEMQ